MTLSWWLHYKVSVYITLHFYFKLWFDLLNWVKFRRRSQTQCRTDMVHTQNLVYSFCWQCLTLGAPIFIPTNPKQRQLTQREISITIYSNMRQYNVCVLVRVHGRVRVHVPWPRSCSWPRPWLRPWPRPVFSGCPYQCSCPWTCPWPCPCLCPCTCLFRYPCSPWRCLWPWLVSVSVAMSRDRVRGRDCLRASVYGRSVSVSAFEFTAVTVSVTVSVS